uniref:choloylglycine hydrolase n=1 Tax=Eubacterium cellulosolvens (strain ATCC 43171 / JCM 9499 / 6) TaxID=633697 RepID=I5AXQ3_EUBC6
MCTAITYSTQDHYFGRNLDLEFSYHEEVTITPRNFPFAFRCKNTIGQHYALIGMAFVVDNYPLYYDAINEKGLGMAGLNFPGNADYKNECPDADNIAPFEFIPWILCQCASVAEARELLSRINLVDINFSSELPLSPLHWMIADQKEAIVVEPVKEGLKVHDNPVGVMTNNPPFDKQLFFLSNYMNLSPEPARNAFAKEIGLEEYSRGMGAIGLPGDLSSASRFAKAAFTRMNAVSGSSEAESVSQFFHILGSVEQQRGCVHLGNHKYEITIYSSCCNMDKGIYYYRTYENPQVTAVKLFAEDLSGKELFRYPLRKEMQILYEEQGKA